MNEVFELETLRRAARLAGFAWTDEELEAIRPAAEAAARLLAALDTVPLDEAVEPTTQYRIL